MLLNLIWVNKSARSEHCCDFGLHVKGQFAQPYAVKRKLHSLESLQCNPTSGKGKFRDF